MYSCTPESTEYPKKYVYNSYTLSSGDMFTKESDSTLKIVQGKDDYIMEMADTFRLILDSLGIGQQNIVKSLEFIDETLVRIEVIYEFGQVVDSLVTYYENNSFIYVPQTDSLDYVIGFKESEYLIVKDFAAVIVRPLVSTPNQNRKFEYSIYDHGDTLIKDYITNINESGEFYIGDTIISLKLTFNYDIE